MNTRNKDNLDILWIKDETLEDSENLPIPPNEVARDIIKGLEVEEFSSVEKSLATKEEK